MAAPLEAQTELFAESRPGFSSQPPRTTVSATPKPIPASIKPSGPRSAVSPQIRNYFHMERCRFMVVANELLHMFVTNSFSL